MSDVSSTSSEKPQLSIQAFYLRHMSLETAISPRSLRSGLTPEMKLELRVQINPLEKEDEVVLDLAISARNGSNLLYIIKIHQAGAFVLMNFTPEQKAFFLNTTCANLLYPYASQKANALAVDAGFPPVNLLPIDFAHMYAQQQQAAQDNTLSTPSMEATSQNRWENSTTSRQTEKEAH